MTKESCRRKVFWGHTVSKSLWPSLRGTPQQTVRHGNRAVAGSSHHDPQAQGRENYPRMTWNSEPSKGTPSNTAPNPSQIVSPTANQVFQQYEPMGAIFVQTTTPHIQNHGCICKVLSENITNAYVGSQFSQVRRSLFLYSVVRAFSWCKMQLSTFGGKAHDVTSIPTSTGSDAD